jgi:hypothetical protein
MEHCCLAYPTPKVAPINILRLGHGLERGSLGFKMPATGIPMNGDAVAPTHNGSPGKMRRIGKATDGCFSDSGRCLKARTSAWLNATPTPRARIGSCTAISVAPCAARAAAELVKARCAWRKRRGSDSFNARASRSRSRK